ncbi:MAG TPA: hypothetical protein ENJ48_01545 [Anaerolineae bacterium]|nr:hypothetical protein [Anaerolineae bacterium]
MLRVAVAGNPNVGKTSLFNELTGSRYQVGNYPGVTVDVPGSCTKGATTKGYFCKSPTNPRLMCPYPAKHTPSACSSRHRHRAIFRHCRRAVATCCVCISPPMYWKASRRWQKWQRTNSE